MNKIKHFMLPEHTNKLYTEEAISSVSLTRGVAGKINELVDAYNELNKEDLLWKHEQEGRIRKGVLYMKDNLINSLNDILESYGKDNVIRSTMIEIYRDFLGETTAYVSPQMFGAVGDGIVDDYEAFAKSFTK